MTLTKVKSSNIAAVGFADGRLIVEFKSGTRYSYAATAEEYDALLKADSIGSYFSRVIRPRPAHFLKAGDGD